MPKKRRKIIEFIQTRTAKMKKLIIAFQPCPQHHHHRQKPSSKFISDSEDEEEESKPTEVRDKTPEGKTTAESDSDFFNDEVTSKPPRTPGRQSSSDDQIEREKVKIKSPTPPPPPKVDLKVDIKVQARPVGRPRKDLNAPKAQETAAIAIFQG
jgi:hypothetical protein